MYENISQFWLYIAAAVERLISLVVSAHVVLHKRETRAAIGWVGVVWLTPFLGTVLYVLFGINRIRRRAQSLRPEFTYTSTSGRTAFAPNGQVVQALGADYAYLEALARLVSGVSQRPLLPGNRVTPYRNGDEAYPAMLGAIDGSRRSVSLATYIFGNDDVGIQFLEALSAAVARKVEVRVLIDDVGARYSFPSMSGKLRKAGIPVARFMPTLLPGRFKYTNLRNHRKLLVVDGTYGFTGGMNIREGNMLQLQTKSPIKDLHFRVDGPVVGHLQEVFASDWRFTTDEVLSGEPWFTEIGDSGIALARGISDGPDEDFEKCLMTILGALNCARRRVTIVTPYFLPETALITTLNVAALRGVDVNIVLPEASNLPLVKWASTPVLSQLLERGCRIWLSPPPFDHTKLLIVDDVWCLVGSANWDPRSLRLNFEFDIECYDPALAQTLAEIADDKIKQSVPVTLERLNQRNLAVKIRDGVARLATPYL